MKYSIIGTGALGTALARRLTQKGIPVNIANTRGPESMAALVDELGSNVTPMTLKAALRAKVVILAVPYPAHANIAKLKSDWSSKIIVDPMDATGYVPKGRKHDTSSEIVRCAFSGADVVRTFNHISAELLLTDPEIEGGRRLMFLAGTFLTGISIVGKLVDKLGYTACVIGEINSGDRITNRRGIISINGSSRQMISI